MSVRSDLWAVKPDGEVWTYILAMGRDAEPSRFPRNAFMAPDGRIALNVGGMFLAAVKEA